MLLLLFTTSIHALAHGIQTFNILEPCETLHAGDVACLQYSLGQYIF